MLVESIFHLMASWLSVSDGPSLVRLMLRHKALSAGKSHQIQCEAIGARPKADITWWLAGKQVRGPIHLLHNYLINYT